MPKGTPICLKCPHCRRGMYGHAPRDKGVRPTGRVELQVRRSAHQGHGSGGGGFWGHRGEVECLDCGHRWYSFSPWSGRISCFGGDHCPASAPKVKEGEP